MIYSIIKVNGILYLFASIWDYSSDEANLQQFPDIA